MTYYTGYRLARFVFAMAAWVAVSLLTYYFLFPQAQEYWLDMGNYTWQQLGFWLNFGHVLGRALLPPLVIAIWAFYELIAYLDSRSDHR